MSSDHDNNPKNASCKDKDWLTQKKTIFQYLQDHIATASMVCAATGVPQKCFTRYKRDYEKLDLLWEVEKNYCKRTGFLAWYLTTDPGNTPLKNQLGLF